MRRSSRFVDYAYRLPVINRLMERCYPLWLHTHHTLRWNYGQNVPSRRVFYHQMPTLNPVQRQVVADLETNGIAVTTVDALGIASEEWQRLAATVDAFSANVQQLLAQTDPPDRASLPATLHHNQERFQRFLTGAAKGDDYMLKLYPEGPTLSLDNPLLRIGLNPTILDTVNSYLGLWAKLLYTDAWHTIPAYMGQRIGSQRWHRDPEDRRMIKVYLYCSDVDAGAGPMQYTCGSTLGGPYGHLWQWRASGGAAHYPPEEAVEQEIPATAWFDCTGGRGTLIFCDTSGLHRGGIATTHARVLATWTYVTPASLYLRRFALADDWESSRLSDAAAFALQHDSIDGEVRL